MGSDRGGDIVVLLRINELFVARMAAGDARRNIRRPSR